MGAHDAPRDEHIIEGGETAVEVAGNEFGAKAQLLQARDRCVAVIVRARR